MSSLSTLGRVFLPSLMLFAASAGAETTDSPPATSAAEAKTQTVVDDAGRFVATFPSPVQRGSQDVDTKVGKVTMNTVYHDGGAIAYMVIFSDYPAGSVAQSGGPEKVCQNASDGAVQSENAKVRTSSPCQLGDVTGLDVVADIPPKSTDAAAASTVFHGRFFVVGDRLYQVMYISPPDNEASAEAGAFFDSFRLIR